jgi:DNA-binding transcriptional ArsR family regulator
MHNAPGAIFGTLVDPTFPRIFERLAREGEQTVGALTSQSGVSQPAVSKHLDPANRLVELGIRRSVSAACEQNRRDAPAADVFGSPVYVLDGEVFWGGTGSNCSRDALKSGRAPYRSQV